MLSKTKGIVLNYIKYRETSIITKIYTDAGGITSFIVNGVRTSKSRRGIAFFQPLTLLELVIYENKKGNLKRISEMRCTEPFVSIHANIKKTSIGIFITEVLLKCLKEEQGNPRLFEFLYQSILVLEHLHEKYENFHLQFLLKLPKFLGFAPHHAGEIFEQLQTAGYKIQRPEKRLEMINALQKIPYDRPYAVDNHQRKLILDELINFYHLHIDYMGEIKSVSVLNEVFHD